MGRKKGVVPIISIDSTSGMDIMTIKKTNRPDFQKLFSVCIKKLELASERSYYRHRGCDSNIYAKQRELLLKYQGIDIGDGSDLFGLASPYGNKPCNGVKLKTKRGKRGSKKNKKRSTVIGCGNTSGIVPYRQNSASTLERLLFDEDIDKGTIYLDSSIQSEDSNEAYEIDSSTKTHNKVIYFYDNVINPTERLEFGDVHSFDEYCQENHISISDYDCKQLLSNDVTHCCVSPYGSSMGGEKLLISDTSYGGLRWLCCEDDAELCSTKMRYF